MFHVVSIHALLAECDLLIRRYLAPEKLFQSTHSLRSATGISACFLIIVRGFNPRTPCGVRQAVKVEEQVESLFQSTHSLRSATSWQNVSSSPAWCFNPRTPCGVRLCGGQPRAVSDGFNPRTPCGVRLFFWYLLALFHVVSIHALLAECDGLFRGIKIVPHGFNPRTPCGVRQSSGVNGRESTMFQSTHSLRSATGFKL